MAMNDFLDMVVDDESPSQISDEIKNLLFVKAAERVDFFVRKLQTICLKILR